MSEFQCRVRNTTINFTVSESKSVLSAAYEAGVKLTYRCASGSCGVCKVRLTSGRVSMDHSGGISRHDIVDGYILPCCAVPCSNLEIEPISPC
ncbi:2Fe-2S iron-sulfur cluster binding domain-containing protein [Serratia marcescens]|nr:2Fe-2S iron-sulfur cluster binding domain-containing protein [Serratia marcescens]ELQ9442112.1 2Fe-2S iron-sulfur cluster binding domain-containing protein [Serratia marcescens]ELT5562902.1 2Fe-2S iron-sulfur cluster binding domain-containing protein [Serratia marcescens]